MLVVVRFVVHCLSVSLGPNSWVRAWELRLTFVIWAIISFQLLGWFDAVERTLDGIDLVPGKTTFSLWALLKGFVVIAGFLLVTSLIARTIERRVMKVEGLAISTRIGISKFSTFALIGLGILLGINASGVDLTVLGLFTGAIGLGLGFGLQAIASNFVSGFVLLMDKSIKPGDVISFTGTTGTSPRLGWGRSCAAATSWFATAGTAGDPGPNQTLSEFRLNLSYRQRCACGAVRSF